MVLGPVQALFATWRTLQQTARAMVELDRELPVPSNGGEDFRALNALLGLDRMSAWESALHLASDGGAIRR